MGTELARTNAFNYTWCSTHDKHVVECFEDHHPEIARYEAIRQRTESDHLNGEVCEHGKAYSEPCISCRHEFLGFIHARGEVVEDGSPVDKSKTQRGDGSQAK